MRTLTMLALIVGIVIGGFGVFAMTDQADAQTPTYLVHSVYYGAGAIGETLSADVAAERGARRLGDAISTLTADGSDVVSVTQSGGVVVLIDGIGWSMTYTIVIKHE